MHGTSGKPGECLAGWQDGNSSAESRESHAPPTWVECGAANATRANKQASEQNQPPGYTGKVTDRSAKDNNLDECYIYLE